MCEVSAREETDIRSKIEAYQTLGLAPLYVVPAKAIGAKADTPEALAKLHACEVSVPEWVRAIANPMPLEAMSNFVRNSNRSMPPYREAILSNADLAEIHAYLTSVPKSPDPKSLPLLDQ